MRKIRLTVTLDEETFNIIAKHQFKLQQATRRPVSISETIRHIIKEFDRATNSEEGKKNE